MPDYRLDNDQIARATPRFDLTEAQIKQEQKNAAAHHTPENPRNAIPSFDNAKVTLTSTTRSGQIVKDLEQIDNLLSPYLGPIHPVRKELRKVIDSHIEKF